MRDKVSQSGCTSFVSLFFSPSVEQMEEGLGTKEKGRRTSVLEWIEWDNEFERTEEEEGEKQGRILLIPGLDVNEFTHLCTNSSQGRE